MTTIFACDTVAEFKIEYLYELHGYIITEVSFSINEYLQI